MSTFLGRLCLVFTLTVFVGDCLAQTTGTIHGQVTDPGGASISAAKVRVENMATALTANGTTNDEGVYLVPSLPPGSYRVMVEAPGFKVFSQSGVVVEVGQNARVNAMLQLGSVNESVEVQ